MANYDFTYRTNYFRVKDEDAYQEFIKHIRNISPTEDFSKIKDGIVWHGMGGYDCTPEYIDLPLETETIKNMLENDKKFYDRNHNLIPENGKTLNDYELIFNEENEIVYDIDDAYQDDSFDRFLDELQKLLPDDDCFVYMESGHEKLRYVTGYALVMTSTTRKEMSLDTFINNTVKNLFGENFTTQYCY